MLPLAFIKNERKAEKEEMDTVHSESGGVNINTNSTTATKQSHVVRFPDPTTTASGSGNDKKKSVVKNEEDEEKK